jgi:hypothetical protein
VIVLGLLALRSGAVVKTLEPVTGQTDQLVGHCGSLPPLVAGFRNVQVTRLLRR